MSSAERFVDKFHFQHGSILHVQFTYLGGYLLLPIAIDVSGPAKVLELCHSISSKTHILCQKMHKHVIYRNLLIWLNYFISLTLRNSIQLISKLTKKDILSFDRREIFSLFFMMVQYDKNLLTQQVKEYSWFEWFWLFVHALDKG